MKNLKNDFSEKIAIFAYQKQDFCTEISGKVVISPKQPSMVMGKARGLCGTSMGLSLPCYRNLQMFL